MTTKNQDEKINKTTVKIIIYLVVVGKKNLTTLGGGRARDPRCHENGSTLSVNRVSKDKRGLVGRGGACWQ